MQKTYNIGVEATIDAIGGKWKPVILCHLNHHEAIRTSEFRRLIPGISQKMLTAHLRELDESGLIIRKSYNQVPPRVEYSLTEYGKKLEPVLSVLCSWGELHIEKRIEDGENICLIKSDEELLG
ncbi:winged helix-turn-helix transcriptional regulator [Kurthia sibirica]|uniref:MarR family transcriptional regulator n=1 Tax=Kurthia sibirica TaxID=202750 RepID=A0A2U3AH99_9BACL|nr:helix-turn-helix domain-containing protein [Kurthia sibirica]PWI23887.1 MarR family transcriptional regulator [Kurthia sibirica]GEK35037.1 MarR family transcriptional regulator [Kurthia sibirica]